MSDIIQLLPDSVANQIAAGEVIQRPASVIKELVENAVDAGANMINVLVVDAGRTSIQVIDDGKGMSDTDARLSFERHATSKIRKADDLFALHTMGFRGEALASIAAVAQVELRTRTADSEIGTQLLVAGSRVEEQQPVSCPVGSNFKVENLFYNVPARRKFLKSNSTELNNIITAFERIVLVYPQIGFTLHSNGTELMNLRAGSYHQRISDVFGKRFNQDLLSLGVETSMCKISGFVGKPETARKKGVHEYFFVNGRYMRHPYFHKAVINAYERLIPAGMQVPYFIYFDVEPGDIDVNIHPTKTEIKFENEQAIWQILTATVKDALGRFCDIPTIDFDTEGKPDIPVFGNDDNPVLPSIDYNPSYNPFKSGNTSKPKVINNWESLYSFSSNDNSVQKDMFSDMPKEPADSGLFGNTDNLVVEDKSPTHYQYKGTYIMTAVKSGLMIIDQHRADVRIRYERYLAQQNQHASVSQRILFPETVQLPLSDVVLLEKILPELTNLGFELTDLGNNCYAIIGVPAGIEGLNPKSLLLDMVHDVMNGDDSVAEIKKNLSISLARNAALPKGQLLSNAEMEELINGLFSCSNMNYTPDGEPILSILPQRDIEQLLL
jgi:DNA mismatch repair protein MutL